MKTHTNAFRRARQRGVSLIAAIFLLVVLTGLGVAIVSMSTSQQIASAMDVQGSRAYQAARAGIEWGLYKQLIPQGAAKACVFSSTTFKLPVGTTLSNFYVTVTCTDSSLGTLLRHRMVATACNVAGGCTASNNIDYVQRRIQVDF
jgi:MSHA biogenesis protein MshP